LTVPAGPPLEGNFTFVFTDIEGSTVHTRRFEESVGHGAYERLRDRHRAVLLPLVHENGGWEAQRAGDGHFFVFEDAVSALKAVAAFQRAPAVHDEIDGTRVTLTVRVGVHTCYETRRRETTETADGRTLYEFPGADTNFAARVGAIGAGGQIIVSDSFVRAVWGDPLLNGFRKVVQDPPEDRDAPHAAAPGLALRCWPGRSLKSHEGEPRHVFEVLYDDASRAWVREPGSRFFPDFYVREVNRYIERQDKQEAVFAALGLSGGPTGRDRQANIPIILAQGGMGKTRLAVTCALRAAAQYRDGVYLVSLAMPQEDAAEGKGNEEFLAARLTASLPKRRRDEWGLSRAEGQPPPTLDEVIAALAKRDLLFVLDNYESLQHEVGRKFLRTLANETRLDAIVTTRIWPAVQGIGTPVNVDEGMAEPEARSLVQDRIRANPEGATDWTPNEQERAQVAELIHLTYASPLALEMAAAHVSPAFPLARVVADLRDRPLGYALATFSNWDDDMAYRRHQSIIRTLDWSFGLLGENAKRAFAASGLFADSFAQDALASVAAVDPLVVARLTQHSLLRPADNGGERLALHHVTRAYARICLLGGEVVTHLGDDGPIKETRPARPDAGEIGARYVDWYAALIQSHHLPDGKTLNIDSSEVRAVLDKERADILAAAHEVCAMGDTARLYLFVDFGSFLWRVGYWQDAFDLFRAVRTFVLQADDLRGIAWKAMYERTDALDNLNRWGEAMKRYVRILLIEEELGNKHTEATSLNGNANVLDNLGSGQEALESHDQNIEIERTPGDRHGEAVSLNELGIVAYRQNDFESAANYLRSAADALLGLGDKPGASKVLRNLASVQWQAGHGAVALATAREAVAVLAGTQYEQGKEEAAALLMQLSTAC
jgi:class 3 adenylate cyclase/predicted ATPase